MLENQLPYRLLKWLMEWSGKEALLKKSIEVYINAQVCVPQPQDQSSILRFTCLSSLSWYLSRKSMQPPKKKQDDGDAIHLLDLLRTCLLDKHQRSNWEYSFANWNSYRNVQELRAAGIQVERNKRENSCLSDISFTQILGLGYVWVSPIIVDGSTMPKFLNLIAYENCSDFVNNRGITSYISFLDSLISGANDVKELRKAGVLCNFLGSDEGVAQLFNEMRKELVPNFDLHADVHIGIHKHYGTFMSRLFQFYNDHFAGTWSIAGFLGVVIGLILGAIQTWYTVKQQPNSHRSS